MQTTVVGNYPKIPNKPKPARLRNAINKRDRGDLTDEDVRAIENEVTAEVIAEQVEAGLDIVTDGQVRWDDDQTYVARRLAGIEIGGLQRYLDTNTYYRQPEVVGEIGFKEPVLAGHWKAAQEMSSKPVKAIVPGPYTLAALSADKHYGSREKVAKAFAQALRSEIEALIGAGCKHIQVNDPVIVFNKDDYGTFHEAITTLLDAFSGAELGVYTWFGDCQGILSQMLELPCDVIGLDFVAGQENWEALGETQFGKKLGAGTVDGRNTRLESANEVTESVRRALESVPGERLYVNPSCGLEYVPREVAFAKLKTMVEGAREAEGVPA
ncbi:MAG TPA: uroporphyrinogen decarboxylase family protein [Dehalococcoidia bacterium]|nr:uroporphyrinogen decarboxylase family protein [Dehalococcoidia bacterium]